MTHRPQLLLAAWLLAMAPVLHAQPTSTPAAPATPPPSASGAAWTDGAGVDIEVRPNVAYRTASGQELKLDLFLPAGRHRGTPPPLLINIHGGGWVAGNKEAAVLRLLPYLQRGWAAANVQYRLGPVALAPAAVEDVRCALRFATARAKEWGFDASRIVLSGGSAGGHLALMAGMLPDGHRFDRACATEGRERWTSGVEPPLRVVAVVNWFGITDVADLLAGANAKHYAIEWFGSQPDAERAALAREVSPLHHVRAGGPAVFTVHGTADDLVPYAHAERLHQALARAGVRHELMTVPEGGHGFGRAVVEQAHQRLFQFLQPLLQRP